MKKSAMAVAALLAACNTAPPSLLPPPFGPDGPSPPRLFFPTGLAQTHDGTLLVANGNFNRAFDSGTVVSISRGYLDTLFRNQLDCDPLPAGDGGVSQQPAACIINPIPPEQFPGSVMIGSFAGPLALNTDGTVALAGSRDTGLLNSVGVEPGGVLHCTADSGGAASQDCRQGLTKLDLPDAGVDGPFTIVPGDTYLPGTAVAKPVLFVSSIIPHVDSISGGVPLTSSNVAVLDMQDPTVLLYTMRAATEFVAGGTGVGPMVFDSVRRALFLGGCYVRSTALGTGTPGSTVCVGGTTNYLRILNVDSMDAVDPVVLDLRSDVRSTYTVQLLLGDPDPANQGAPKTLWATMRGPDSLVRIELPVTDPSVIPRVRKIIPLPISPADMVRIVRTGAPDLIAVAAERQNSVAIVDTTTDEVVAEVGQLGDAPFFIRQIDCPVDMAGAPSFSGSACLVTSVFGACRIALIEVPLGQPSQSKLRALAGSCPQ